MNAASLFDLAGPDLILILLITLLLFGAKKLPPLAGGMGEAIRQFRKARREWRDEEAGPWGKKGGPVAFINLLLIPIAIAFLLLACGLWLCGNSR